MSALRALPPRQRQAIALRYYADLAEAQIAAIMGVSEGTVKTHIFRAVASLRAALDEHAVPPRFSPLPRLAALGCKARRPSMLPGYSRQVAASHGH